jgi:hypothetical protein
MNDDRLKQRIREIAGSVKNIRDDELFTLLDNHIQPFCLSRELPYDHRSRGGSHHVFTVGACTFNIVKPHGTSLLKPVYVRTFLEAMEEIDLYEEGMRR